MGEIKLKYRCHTVNITPFQRGKVKFTSCHLAASTSHGDQHWLLSTIQQHIWSSTKKKTHTHDTPILKRASLATWSCLHQSHVTHADLQSTCWICFLLLEHSCWSPWHPSFRIWLSSDKAICTGMEILAIFITYSQWRNNLQSSVITWDFS